MKLYAERPVRLVPQLIFDAVIAAWLIFWWNIANRVNDTTDASTVGANKLETSASSLAGNLTEAGQRLRKVPLVGDTLQSPFDKSASAAKQISAAGRDMSTGIDDLGDLLGFLTAAAPYLFALLLWGVVRGPYLHKASQAAKLRKTTAGMDVLALRALQHRSAAELFAVSAGPAASWRTGDEETTRALAELHLRKLGLREPRPEAIASRAATARPVTASAPHDRMTGTSTAPIDRPDIETDEVTAPKE